jgi:D-glycero-alpha-D-manno-heptose-7-phosphate kinase
VPLAAGGFGYAIETQIHSMRKETRELIVPDPIRFGKIRARAPLRIGLAGGGTDLSPYCDEFGGAVLNVTIDRFAFASCIARDDDRVIFEADDIGVCEEWGEGSALPLHRGVYERMINEFNGGRPVPMTLRTTVDAPAGSGLGSSSALVVAMVDALREILQAPLGPYDVARLAYEIERIDLKLSGGRQDQYAAAFGGINYIEFLPDDRVVVNPLRARRDVFCELESSLVICFSGRSRESASIIDDQKTAMQSGDRDAMTALHRLKSDAAEMKTAFTAGDIDRMAEILRRSWEAKKATAAAVSNSAIDELLELGLANGALAGKVSGAGGGGFLFFFVHPENRFRLISALNEASGKASMVKFTETGSETWTFR